MGAAARQQTKWSTILRPSTRDNQFWLKGADYEAARVPECGAAASLLPTLTLNLSPEPGAVSGLGVMVWWCELFAKMLCPTPDHLQCQCSELERDTGDQKPWGEDQRAISATVTPVRVCSVVTTELPLSTSISTRVAGPSQGTCSNPA